MFKIATWNVNSIKVRLPQVLDWLQTQQPTVLAMQETKSIDEDFPAEAFTKLGYDVFYSGQKTYNGVAVASRNHIEAFSESLLESDPQKRFLECEVDGIRIVNVYVPNGQSLESDKFQYKLKWLEALHQRLQKTLEENPKVIILGDFNIAPHDVDVHDPAQWQDQVLCSVPERQAFERLLSLGFCDSFRLFEQEENRFSWWDYRRLGFQLNKGLRIDHLLISEAIAESATACYIDKAPRKLERPSDHAPVVLELQ